ncbi:MAG: UTP--glucose-1-phosphate uridylyltransferase GalU [Gammaproteobacteria bacterium]
MRIRKAVFPVAGLGTRFLPATKASPKEMLPVVDKPLIQYAVQEAISAGAQELIFITGRSKNSIMDHFDKAYELETELAQKNKDDLLRIVQDVLPAGVTRIFIRQASALGLGHAVLCAQPAIGDEDFAVLLADDLIDGGRKPCLSQMQAAYHEYGASVIAVEKVPMEEVSSYGVVEAHAIRPGLGEIRRIVEKPRREEAPSNLAVVGRYILTPRIFKLLEKTGRGKGGEIQLTDAIGQLIQEQTVLACEFEGVRYDCGSKLGYLKANVEYALQHAELSDEFREYLKQLTAGWQAPVKLVKK